jgi:Holliday junction DNA helicase RuvA
LSSMSVAGFHRCIREKDLLSLTRIPGVGKKTAERLLVEMADRLPSGADAALITTTEPGDAQAESEATSALLALGYRPAETLRMLADIDAAGQTAETLIREALRRAHAGGR